MFYVLLFIAGAIAEVYLMLIVAQLIGAFHTILIMVITAVIGIFFAKLEGFGLLNKVKKEFKEDLEMTDSVIECLFVFIGVFFMVLPGFLTDALGVLFIIPPTRIYFTKRVSPRFRSKIESAIDKKKEEFIAKKKH